MTDGKITFLTEIELPPYCFMSEAVEWIAYGRVPQMQYHSDRSTDEPVDYRFFWREMPDNFQPGFQYPWFDRLEFESLRVPVHEDYFRAAEKCAFENVDSLPDLIADYEARQPSLVSNDDGTTFDIWKNLAGEYRDKLKELGPLQEFVDSIEARFRPHRDIASAKLFQLLVTGEMNSQAIDHDRWEAMADAGEYEAAARFDDVPPDVYTLGLDWLSDEITVSGRRHVALRVEVADLLKHRSTLMKAGEAVSVERFGAFYLSGHLSRSNRTKPRRGRRAVVNWTLIKLHLRQLEAGNKLPNGKENCIYELIAFAEKELGKSPSRTSVQRNMADELDALYAQN